MIDAQSTTKIRSTVEQIEGDVAAAAANFANGADTLDQQSEELQNKAREFGRDLLEGARELTDKVTKQAHLRPLAVFGVAFVAGVVVARMLRR